VFGCKCFILNKRPKTSKFAPKVDEGILLFYGSNEHAYRVFNKTLSRVEVTVDVTFDESNGSQVEQVDSSVVGKEDLPCEAIKQLAIGDIMPQEDQATDDEDPQVVDTPIFTGILHQEGQHSPTEVQHGGSAAPPTSAVASPTSSTSLPGLNLEPIFEQEEAEGPEEGQGGVEHPRLRQTIQRDHPVDNILGSIQKGVTTHSHLANFCQYYSFVSSLEPLKVEQALGDPDWVMAMQEELNNFERNQV
jgi:hypothetical protein